MNIYELLSETESKATVSKSREQAVRSDIGRVNDSIFKNGEITGPKIAEQISEGMNRLGCHGELQALAEGSAKSEHGNAIPASGVKGALDVGTVTAGEFVNQVSIAVHDELNIPVAEKNSPAKPEVVIIEKGVNNASNNAFSFNAGEASGNSAIPISEKEG